MTIGKRLTVKVVDTRKNTANRSVTDVCSGPYNTSAAGRSHKERLNSTGSIAATSELGLDDGRARTR
jgi:hypothetical protein